MKISELQIYDRNQFDFNNDVIIINKNGLQTYQDSLGGFLDWFTKYQNTTLYDQDLPMPASDSLILYRSSTNDMVKVNLSDILNLVIPTNNIIESDVTLTQGKIFAMKDCENQPYASDYYLTNYSFTSGNQYIQPIDAEIIMTGSSLATQYTSGDGIIVFHYVNGAQIGYAPVSAFVGIEHDAVVKINLGNILGSVEYFSGAGVWDVQNPGYRKGGIYNTTNSRNPKRNSIIWFYVCRTRNENKNKI